MSSSILIILGHPDNDSFCERILNAYAEGAKASGAQVDIVRLSDLNFNVNLKAGYRQRQELEPDLEICRAKIERANHIVIVYPNWWGGPPALLKGFIDRLFLPKWAFTSKEGAFPVGLLKGKSARVIVTMDSPYLWYLFVGAPGTRMLSNCILKFCGFKPVRVSHVAQVRGMVEQKRQKVLEKFRIMGQKLQ